MQISAIEFKLGSKIETLAEACEHNPDWQADRLLAKTGIMQRHLATPEESPLSLAVDACERVFNDAGRNRIDGLIYVTQSPESTIPTTACLLHERLGLPENCLAFDLNQGCSGFVYGLSMASALIRTEQISKCLLVCTEGYSKYISPHDRTCRPIFSDGASAVIIDADGKGDIGPFVFATDGKGAPNLTLKKNNGVAGVGDQILHMNGPKVLDFTMEAVPESVLRLIDKAGFALGDIDVFVFHQASKVVLDRVRRKLDIKETKMFRNYRDMGNTVSATIPVAMKEARSAGVLTPDMTVLLMGFGVGYSLAGCIIRT